MWYFLILSSALPLVCLLYCRSASPKTELFFAFCFVLCSMACRLLAVFVFVFVVFAGVGGEARGGDKAHPGYRLRWGRQPHLFQV